MHAQAGGLRILNHGRDTGDASVTRFYLSPDCSSGASDLLVGQRASTCWSDSVTHLGSRPVTLPSASGRRHFIAVADGAGPVAESSETNNPRSKFITINTP